MDCNNIKARPFLKWTGGKSQLLEDIIPLIDGSVENSESFIYVEPFIGGGATMFEILSRYGDKVKCAVINDLNSDLTNCYAVIKDDSLVTELKSILSDYESRYNESDDKKSRYLEYRDCWNKNKDSLSRVERAALFITLNKLYFNGIWRVNSKGEFNVPWNQCKVAKIFDSENIDACHEVLKKVIMMNGDFVATELSITLAEIMKSDLVFYMDPPYRPVSKTSSFVGYTKECFNDSDQERLKEFCDEIDSKGGSFILSNSKSGDYFENLYSSYNIRYVKARRSVNSAGDGRGKVDELLISNRNIPITFALF